MIRPELLERPLWAEGVLLGQQHFQCWDRYQEISQARRVAAATPFAYGLLQRQLDEEALAEGVLRLRRCEAVLPDGRLLAFDEAVDPEVVLDLPQGLPEGGTVHVALTRGDRARGVPGYPEPPGHVAWQPRQEAVGDAHDPERQRDVLLASPVLALTPEPPPEGTVASLPLARLERVDEHGYRLCRDYVPTVARIDAAEGALGVLSRSRSRIVARVAQLRHEQGATGGLSTLGAGEVTRFLLLQVLEPAAVTLRGLEANPGSHPWLLYDALARLGASLAPLAAASGTPAEIPPYDHDSLDTVLRAVEARVAEALAAAMPRDVRAVTLTRESAAVRVAEDIQGVLADGCTLYLAAACASSEAQGEVRLLPQRLRAGARSELERLVAAGLPGITVTHLQHPPGQLPVKSGYEYFRLEPSGIHWRRAREEGSLALYLPAELSWIQLEMVALQEEAKDGDISLREAWDG